MRAPRGTVLRVLLISGLVFGASEAASAQARPPAAGPPAPAEPPQPRSGGSPLRLDLTLTSAFDGNINREVVPLASYGFAPGASLHYDSSRAFGWEYDIALNEYTGTDRWDRVSHAVGAVMRRGSPRLRSETRIEGSWKVPTDDRELTKQAEVSERLTLVASPRTAFQLTGVYRYKYYVDRPGTSGISPYIGARVDRRFGRRGLAVAYRFQTRHSRLRSDRYYRHGLAATFSSPLRGAEDTLSFTAEYRPQVYAAPPGPGGPAARRDRRLLLNATYERPLGARTDLVGLAGYQRRWSNDQTKRFVEPILALTIRYRWR